MNENEDFWGPILPHINKLEAERRFYVAALGEFLLVFNEFERNCKMLYDTCLASNLLPSDCKSKRKKGGYIPVYQICCELIKFQQCLPNEVKSDLKKIKPLLDFRNDVAHCPVNWTYQEDKKTGATQITQVLVGAKNLPKGGLPLNDLPKFTQLAAKLSDALSEDIGRVFTGS